MLFSAVCLWLVATTTGLALHAITGRDVRPAVVESLLVLALSLIFLAQSPVTRFFVSLTRSFKFFSAIFFVALLGGQIAAANTTTFPFAAWTMYDKADTRFVVTFPEYIGILRSGGRIPLNPARLFPVVKRNMLTRNLEQLSQAFNPEFTRPSVKENSETGFLRYWLRQIQTFLRPYPILEEAEMKERMGEIFEAMVHKYNKSHPDDPVTVVEVIRGCLNMKEASDLAVRREVMGIYDIRERHFR